MNWLFKRLQEPSTGAGVAIAAQLAKTLPQLAPYAAALDYVSYLAAGHAVVMPEVSHATDR
jgi:hypothetical protein